MRQASQPLQDKVIPLRGSQAIARMRAVSFERLGGTEVPITCANGEIEVLRVGKLSADQVMALSAVIRDVVTRLQHGQLGRIAAQIGGAKGKKGEDAGARVESFLESDGSLATVIDVMLDTLEPQTIDQLMAILADADETWIHVNVGLPDWAGIIAAALEHNDPALIASLFQRAVRQFSRPSGIASSANTDNDSPPPD
jgi:hypothetical protein